MYKIIWEKLAKKELDNISKPEADRIANKVTTELSTNPHKCELLQGIYRGHRKLRVGNYRVIFTIKENIVTVTIVKVGHRSDVYH